MSHWILLFVAHLSIGQIFCRKAFIGTEESLRANLRDMIDGKLNFYGDNAPVYEEELDDVTPADRSEFDFIVIGAGSGGATVASRLSEIKNLTILLIEAGSNETPLNDIPTMALPMGKNDQIKWQYLTESSNKYCLGFTQSKCLWLKGKATGGSSSINYMVATRGNRRDYDEWAKLTSDDSWSYRNMLKYFKKLEDFRVEGVEIDEKFHNKNGPVHITTSPPSRIAIVDAFIEAAGEFGYPVIDYNGRRQIGASYLQSTIHNGERWSNNRAYLQPSRSRENLFLTKNSHVNKVIIDETTGTARGVEFVKSSRKIRVYAGKEIILSAGAINSPQILMLSGIGPKKHLRDLGIKVVKDAPVGKNLMDHIGFGGLIFKINETVRPAIPDLLEPENSAIRDYIKDRSGPLAMGSGFDAILFMNSDYKNLHDDKPVIELLYGASPGVKDPIMSKVVGISDDYRSQLISDVAKNGHWSVFPMLVKPRSRGSLLLRSKDPNVQPKLYPNYLSNPRDVKAFIKGIRFALKLSQTKSFQRFGSQLEKVPLPHCDNYEFDSDAYWDCSLRTYTLSYFHHSGTCRMGQENDSSAAVVNSRLQVIGIKKLRVVDTSVMPTIVTGHTHIPTTAIAEKISDVIKRDWGYRE